MDVVEWVNAPSSEVSERRTSTRFCPPAMIGLVGTLLIHVSAIPPLYFVNYAHPVHPPEIVESAGYGSRSKAESSQNLVLIDLPSAVNARDRITVDVVAILALNKSTFAMPIDPDPQALASIETLALDEQPESRATTAGGEGEDRARLIGIYSGQIQARIERIWSRPRTPVNDANNSAMESVDYFHCQVQIVQDAVGNVQEILLPNCNGTVAWQHSLIVAIQQASPLPAPPDPKVFSRMLSFEFRGFPYIAGSPDEGYDTQQGQTAQIVAPGKTPDQIAQEFLPYHSKASEQH